MPSKLLMEKFVINLLKEKLPATYCYHDYAHTLYVMDRVVEIAKAENCTTHEINLLKIAALWHDIGYINKYNGHEEEGCKLTQQYLPGYGFSKDEITAICGMIMATKMPQTPKNKLEEIIADADLEYLGTKNASKIANVLFKELRNLVNPSLTKKQWHKAQISFIKKHQYFTKFCKEKKEPIKKTYLKQLLNSIA